MYVRDTYDCWDIGAHFFVEKEDSNTVLDALKIIKKFGSRWKPRYILADQSHVEANSVAKAFPGLLGGEQECAVIFCTVHVMRVWMNKIYETKARGKMIQAIHKTTKIRCDDLIKEAIDLCQVASIKKYIKRNYQNSSNQWAL